MAKGAPVIEPKLEAELCRRCPYLDCIYGPACPIRLHLKSIGIKSQVSQVGSGYEHVIKKSGFSSDDHANWQAWSNV